MLFIHKYAEGRIVLRPTDVVVDELRRKHVIQGLTVEFHNYRYSTEDVSIIKQLLAYPDYNHTFAAACTEQEVAAWKKAHGVLPPDGNPDSLMKESVSPFVLSDTAHDAPKDVEAPVKAQEGLTKEDVGAMIQDAIAKSMAEVLAAINSKPEPVANAAGIPVLDVNKPRKTFHCKICGKDGPEFKTGFEVGKHMREVHPEPKEEV